MSIFNFFKGLFFIQSVGFAQVLAFNSDVLIVKNKKGCLYKIEGIPSIFIKEHNLLLFNLSKLKKQKYSIFLSCNSNFKELEMNREELNYKFIYNFFSKSSQKTNFLLKEKCFQMPIKSKVTSNFGNIRKSIRGYYHHSGVDLRAKLDTKVLTMGRGVIYEVGLSKGSGKYIIVNHGQSLFSKYTHLNKINVKVGESVTKKTVIALSGSTGKSRGPHLHWAIMLQTSFLNPLNFVKTWNNANLCVE